MSPRDAKKAMVEAIKKQDKPLMVKIRNEDGDPDLYVYDPADDCLYFQPYLDETQSMTLMDAKFLALGGLLEDAMHKDDEEDFGETAEDALERIKDQF